MYKIERQEKILDYINEKERASINVLSDIFKVSKVTVRADIEELSDKGLVNKTHGGAVSKNIGISSEIPYEIKSRSNIGAKKKIARAALNYIKKDDFIIIDSGSTTFQMVEGLPDEITVITTDVLVAVEIVKRRKNIRIMLPGGEMEKSVYTLYGIDTIEYFKNLHADKVFLGCDALDFEFGLSDRSRTSAATKRSMIEACDQAYLLTDASKLNKKLAAKVCNSKFIDRVILNEIDDDLKEKFIGAGVHLTITG